MRNLKKFLALVLAMLMVVSAGAAVSAYTDVADDNQYAEAIELLTEYGIVNGIGDDQFGPDQDVKRFQMALMMARALKPAETDWAAGMEIFDDVNEWYGAIQYAYVNNIVTGIGNNQFAPNNGIRYQDALIMALRALGYTVDVTGDPYWLAAYNQADALGLTKNVDVFKGDDVLTRAETAQVIYNMIKATPANGGATIEEKNFGIPGAENQTAFVITATSNQSYEGTEGKLVDDAYVTIQALLADGTLGDALYVEFATLGFAEDVQPDDVMGYLVNLVNFDGENYDSAVPGTATYTSSIEVDKIDANKITIDGRIYYIVDEYTENTIKNEIIIKNAAGTISKVALDAVSDLYFNIDGNVVNPKGDKVLAKKSTVTNAYGETLYYLNTTAADVAHKLYTIDELVNLSDIKKVYDLTETVDGYAPVAEFTSSDAFNIVLFDDNGDTKYDRAIIDPINISVYNTKDNGKERVAGPICKDKDAGVVYSETLTKGDVFVYTYNPQTRFVNVLEILDLQDGVVEKINYNTDADKRTVTIGGETFKFTSVNTDKALGATVHTYNSIDFTADNYIKKVASTPALAEISVSDFYDKTSIGSGIKFYAYNGMIIISEAYDIEEAFQLIAIKEVIDYETDAIIADIYVDGVLVEDAVLTEVWNEDVDKTVVLADLKTASALRVINKYFMGDYDSYVFKGLAVEDGYRIGLPLSTGNAGGTKDSTHFGFKTYTIDSTKWANNKIVFSDGVALANNDVRSNAIRTNDNTVFYFIDTTKGAYDYETRVVVGSADDSVIYFGNNTKIFADKVGFSGDNRGTATRVIVFNATKLEGFGIASQIDAFAYVPKSSSILGKPTVGYADDFGLVGDDYDGTVYYKYTNVAINLNTGSKISIYSANRLATDYTKNSGYIFQIDNNGVIIADVKITTAGLTLANAVNEGILAMTPIEGEEFILNDDEYKYFEDTSVSYGVNSIIFNNRNTYDDDNVTSLIFQAMTADSISTKSNSTARDDWFGGEKGTTDYNVYYLKDAGFAVHAADLADGTFVGIVDTKKENAPTQPETTKTLKVDVTIDKFDTNHQIYVKIELYRTSDATKILETKKVNATGVVEFADLDINITDYDVYVTLIGSDSYMYDLNEIDWNKGVYTVEVD